MKQPSPAGTKIDQARRRRWFDRFLHYKHPPTEGAIDAWLNQFKKDKDLAARLLDSVDVVPRAQMELAFRTLMNNVPGWHRNKSQRSGQWRFVPYSYSSGESGDQMIAYFRQAMQLKERYYDELFVFPSSLTDARLTGDDTLILVDDFAGSGLQATKSWNRLFRELVGGVGRAYLLVVAATVEAQRVIRNDTDLYLLNHLDLSTADSLFDDDCQHFSKEEKNTIEAYCKLHFPDDPRGYEGGGFLFVLAHDCPNNSIPLLHKHKKNKWMPLFPRTLPSN